MNTVAVIPARGGSKGIFRKNVKGLAGRPMIEWTIDAARRVEGISRVVVSTDDDEIASVSRRAGAEVVRRPTELAGDTSSSEGALLHALDALKEEGYEADVLVFLQCTSPLTSAEDIAGALDLLEEDKYDSVLGVSPSHGFLWRYDGEGNAVGINHDKRERLMRQHLEAEYIETGAVYVMRVPGFREAGHRFFGRTGLYVIPAERCHEVDDPVDFKIAEMLMRNAQETNRTTCLPDEIDAVVFDFDGVFTDNRVQISQNGSESVVCNRSDGMGISHLRRQGVRVLVLSSEDNPVVEQRCRKLETECIYGCREKLPALRAWAVQQGLRVEHMVYVGNDVNDIPCMQAAGCGVAVADARPEAKEAARLLLSACGGNGAVREICDLILRRQQETGHAV